MRRASESVAGRTRWTAVAAALACIATTFAAQRPESQFHPLAKTHRWFELRATANDRTPPLIRGALAAAFNDPATAERLLRDVIRTAPASEAADDAYAMLARVYIRSGQYERFARLFQNWVAAIPGSAAVRAERENFEKFRGRPNQIKWRATALRAPPRSCLHVRRGRRTAGGERDLDLRPYHHRLRSRGHRPATTAGVSGASCPGAIARDRRRLTAGLVNNLTDGLAHRRQSELHRYCSRYRAASFRALAQSPRCASTITSRICWRRAASRARRAVSCSRCAHT